MIRGHWEQRTKGDHQQIATMTTCKIFVFVSKLKIENKS